MRDQSFLAHVDTSSCLSWYCFAAHVNAHSCLCRQTSTTKADPCWPMCSTPSQQPWPCCAVALSTQRWPFSSSLSCSTSSTCGSSTSWWWSLSCSSARDSGACAWSGGWGVLRLGRRSRVWNWPPTVTCAELFRWGLPHVGIGCLAVLCSWCRIMLAYPEVLIQRHERFRRTLFIGTKHNMQIVGVIPFIKLQNDT